MIPSQWMDEGRTRTRVLVVDDLGDARRVVTAMLRDAGFGVIEAGSVDDALAVDSNIDVVLTDVEMLRRSGAELIALLKERRPGCQSLQ